MNIAVKSYLTSYSYNNYSSGNNTAWNNNGVNTPDLGKSQSMSGSSLNWGNAEGWTHSQLVTLGSGTWRLMGGGQSSTAARRTSLYIRIS